MRNRRLLLGTLSLTFGVAALFPLTGTGATSVPAVPAPAIGIALVGNAATGTVAAPVMTLVHTDAESGRTSYAFVDEHGQPVAP